MKEKNIYFLCGMPRAGNTLLGSLINQNSKLNITANTVLCDVLYQLILLKEELNFQNFPDHKSFNCIFDNVFKNYYSSWKCKNILDRGPWGTPVNLYILKKIIEKPKFVILYRPILEVLASFIKKEKPKNLEKYCDEMMNPETGMIGKNLFSIKNLIKLKENYIIIEYKNLCKNPITEIKKIYKFLNIPYENINTKKFKQFSANNTIYNDSVLSASLHKIKTDNILLNKSNFKKILPQKIIDKYSSFDIF